MKDDKSYDYTDGFSDIIHTARFIILYLLSLLTQSNLHPLCILIRLGMPLGDIKWKV